MNTNRTLSNTVSTPESVLEYLSKHGLTLTTAESCTAGLICSLIADVSGCGEAFHSGFVVYSVDAKQACLGVKRETIDIHGLTSEAVAKEMAHGALQRYTTRKYRPNFAVADTGTAESNDPLNGVVCFAYALRKRNNEIAVVSETVRFDGERNSVRKQAALHAIESLPKMYQHLKRY